jgi:predicted nucleotidyltransferase
MYIDKNSKISQFSAIKVRDLLKRLKDNPFNLDQVCHYFKEKPKKIINFLSDLEDAGYIEKSKNFINPQHWIVTLKGSRLSLASAAKPVKRETAEKRLQEFMERVDRVNSDKYYLYKVSKVVIFGSFLSNKDRINDIDIAVKLLPKISDTKKRREKEQQRIKDAYKSGRTFNNFVDELFWPHSEVMYYLKARKRTISLHTIDDEILDKCEVKVIFEDFSEN